MQNLKKKIFIFFLFVYLLIGSLNSINTGISFDEYHEELNWKFHVNIFINIKNVITNKERFKKKEFNEEVKRFVGYGIGSQILVDIGVKKMKLLASPRKMPSMIGYGLQVTEFIENN